MRYELGERCGAEDGEDGVRRQCMPFLIRVHVHAQSESFIPLRRIPMLWTILYRCYFEVVSVVVEFKPSDVCDSSLDEGW